MSLFNSLCLIVLLCLITVNSVLSVTKEHKIIHKHKKVIVRNNSVNPQQPQLQIKNGATVIGAVNKTVDQNKTYYSFRGIPYAKPPVGNLRFKPPVELSGDFAQKTIYATKDAPLCVQSELFSPLTVIGSEDCLYINVYTPQFPTQNSSLLPVMVWIFGGGFIFGDSSYRSFGPDYFLDEENVIVVTFNYRVGIFGFLSTEDEASPGNYGLKDQIMALRWVQSNIQYFGGNPKQVTIFGESAGAASVSYLSQTPLTNGLFHRAILESGSSLTLWGLTRHSRLIAVTTASILKLDVSSSQSLVEGLRKIDYKTLNVVQTVSDYGELLILNPLDSLPFGPTIEPLHPDAVVVNKSHEQLSNGLFHHVPYIIGFNSQESIPFVDILNIIRLYLLKYDISRVALVPASMNIYNIFVKDIVNLKIKSYYFENLPVVLSEKHLMQFVSDDEFNRALLETARLYSQRSNVYLYVFSYEGSIGSGNRTIGVGHGSEMPYIWRQSGNNAYETEADILTRRRLTRLWTNFAKTGNPTPTSDPLLQNAKWPLANDDGPNNLCYLNISSSLTTGINPFWTNFKFWQKLFNDYGNPPYSTY